MEQGTYLNPNPLALERTAGRALFKNTGASSYDDLGIIEMTKIALNPQSDKVMFALPTGAALLGIQENTIVEPLLTIQGRQFTDIIEAYINLGSQDTDNVQSSGSAVTFNLTAALGKTFDIGARNLANVVVTVAASAKTKDVDFFLDAQAGLIRFPFIAAGIAAAAAVVVTFDKPALTRKAYIGGTIINFYGALLYQEFDSKNSYNVRAEWNFPTGQLMPKALGDVDVKKNKTWELDFAITGSWTKLKRAA